MGSRVAIVGVGWCGFKPEMKELSFREMVFEAAVKAYADAGVDARSDVDAFVSCQEDFWEGVAISDEFAPEPLGGVLRPTYTVAGDGLQGIASAYMMISSGAFDVVAVEAHAKPSDIIRIDKVFEMALDPQYVRPLNIENPYFVAGLDARAYMERTGAERVHLAMVTVKNRGNGLLNERASYAARLEVETVLNAEPIVDPLTDYDIAGFADAAIVMVLASEEFARKRSDKPVWLEGIGWATEVGTGLMERHSWGEMPSMRLAAKMAYAQAGISDPRRVTDFAEVEDRFSFMELLCLEELGIVERGRAHLMLERGEFEVKGSYPVNVSGGSLAMGVTLEATGLARLLEAVLQLRGEAGSHQLRDGPRRAIVASWRGPPTYTSIVAVLSADEQ